MRNSNSSRNLESLLAGSLHYTVCKELPTLFVLAGSSFFPVDSFHFDIQKIFSMKGAPAFGIDVVIDDKCVLRFRCVTGGGNYVRSDECAGGRRMVPSCLGISETDVS